MTWLVTKGKLEQSLSWVPMAPLFLPYKPIFTFFHQNCHHDLTYLMTLFQEKSNVRQRKPCRGLASQCILTDSLPGCTLHFIH
jgi:hypothetical protein